MKNLKAIFLDVDGVLTDGGVWWGPNGEEWKRFSFADIMGEYYTDHARRQELTMLEGWLTNAANGQSVLGEQLQKRSA